MSDPDIFDLRDFTPYLLNLAAEQSSLAFQPHYKDRYGMLRTEWRVVFHLGRYGAMTAKEICTRARLHKTKVSRAVTALEKNRFLVKSTLEKDRRLELLQLTKAGQSAYADLSDAARKFDADLMGQFTENEREVLRRCLSRIAGF